MNENLLHRLLTPIFLVDNSTGRIVFRNESFESLLKPESSAAIGNLFLEVFEFEGAWGWAEFVEDYFTENGRLPLKARPTGTVVWAQTNRAEWQSAQCTIFQVVQQPLPMNHPGEGGAGDQIKSLLRINNALIGQINRRGKKEEELINAKELFHYLFQFSPFWMFLLSIDQDTIVDVNEATLRGLNLQRDEIVGRRIADFYHITLEDTIPEIKESILRRGKIQHNDFVMRDGNGKTRIGQFYAELLTLANTLYCICVFQDMTGYRLMQNQLKESEEKFALAFRLSPNWIGICRYRDGVFIDANERMVKGIGLSSHELIGHSIYSLNVLTDAPGFTRILDSLKGGGAVSKILFEVNTRRRGIRKGFLSISTLSMKGELFFIFVFDDRTTFVKLQEMLLESEERYRGMFDNALAGFYRVSRRTGRIVDCNYHFAELLEMASTESVIGKKISDLLYDRNTRTEFNRMLQKYHQGTLEMPLRKRNGSEIWIINYGKVVSRREFTDGVIVDITMRKRIEELLAYSENRFRTLIENSTDLIFIVNQQGVISYVSPSVSRVLGYSSLRQLRRITRLVADRDAERFSQFLNEVVARYATPMSIDVSMKHRNGTYRIMGLTANNLLSEPEIGGIVVNAQDITEKTKAQEEMAQALQKEQELNRQKTHFISTVSHDFRTPLTNISLNIQLLSKYIQEGQNLANVKNLERMSNATKRLTALLNEVSLISKEQSGRLIYNPEPYDSSVLIDSIVEQIDYLFQPNVYPSIQKGKPRQVEADRTLLTHIADNLLGNAIKFSPGRERITFTMSLSEDNLLTIQVQDRGIGIPREELKFLFDPYFRASNVNNIGGSGLGLSIVKRCVELHNGRIELKSNEGRGTTVTVRIPLRAGCINSVNPISGN